MTPPVALIMWNPFLATALRVNARAREAFGTLGTEWQDFAGRQLKENLALMERLTQSRTHDQFIASFTDFWRKAMEDYGREVTTMTKLMTGAMNKMLSAAQSATDEATRLPSSGVG
jgi:hypothetical protein